MAAVGFHCFVIEEEKTETLIETQKFKRSLYQNDELIFTCRNSSIAQPSWYFNLKYDLIVAIMISIAGRNQMHQFNEEPADSP